MAFARPQARAADENAAHVKEDKAPGKAAGQQGAGQRRCGPCTLVPAPDLGVNTASP